MLANHNLKICHTLVRRDFQFHRAKSCVLILAIALVTALYSFVFLLGSSVEHAFLLNYQYTYGSASHILYTGLTWQQADAIAAQAQVKSTVRIRTIGQLSDTRTGQRQIHLTVADPAYAQATSSVPTAGRLPKQPGEIALDEFTMDSLGVQHKTGAPVSFIWTDAQDTERQSDFTLCGWWASPTNFTESCAWITEQTALELDPDCLDEQARNVTLGADLHQTENLDEQAAAILAQLEDTHSIAADFTTNLAYHPMRKEQAKSRALPFYAPAALVLLCGYLMICSIVQVTTEQNRLYYASLKSLGMTPRQIRRLLLEQGVLVLLPGLVPGWLLGFLLHYFITSRLIIGMEQNPAIYFLSWKPFAAAAICMLFTGFLAQLPTAVRLSRMTPAQTSRSASGRVRRRKQISDGRITLPQLAFRTLKHDQRRTLLSAVTLLAAAALLSSVWIRYISLKEARYLSLMSPWDYSITDGSAYLSSQQYNEKNQSISQAVVEELKNRPETRSVSTLKSRELELTAPDKLRTRIIDFYNQPYDDTMTLRETQAGFPDWLEGLDRLEQEGLYVGLIIGLDGEYLDYILKNCPFTSGRFDKDAFASGDYVLAAGSYVDGISTPAAQETVTLMGYTFTVLGSVKHDESYLEGTGSKKASYHISYLVPMQVFDRLFPGQAYRQLAVCIHSSMQDTFEAYLDAYEQGLNRGVGIKKRSEYQAAFTSARLNQLLPELVIGLVLSGIALMNFINMLVIKTIRRKSELAVYQSLGMTHAQLRSLLLLEGSFHALFMIAVIVPAVVIFDRFIMQKIIASMQSQSMVYTFSALPLWLFVIALAALAVVVPLGCLRFITKGSLKERIGQME